MRALAMLVSAVLVVAALSGTIWLARYSPWAEQTPEVKKPWDVAVPVNADSKADASQAGSTGSAAKAPEKDPAIEERPAIPANGPFARAVTGERVFEFGVMGVNEERRHKFQIENKGEAPLHLSKGPTNCKCTISNITDREVAPGKSAEIEMSWTPREADAAFQKTAVIFTSDPENAEIEFKVFGRVLPEFTVTPSHTWHAGHVTDAQDGIANGQIASELDRDFQVASIESTHPLVTATYKRMRAKAMAREGYRSGYDFTVKVDRGIPIGPFRSRLRIHTTLGGNKTVDVEVTALRSGPILFLPPIGTGLTWNAERRLLNMGRIDRNVGRKAAIPLLVYGIDEKFKLLGVESTEKFVNVTLDPDAEVGGGKQQGFRLTFTIPPGIPSVTRIAPDVVKVKLKTNHPRLKELEFQIEFVSQ